MIASHDVASPVKRLSLRDPDLARLFNHLPEKFEESGLGQARTLRAVGQIVESLGLVDFEVEAIADEEYVVRGRLVNPKRRSGIFKRLSMSFHKTNDEQAVELHCTREMIQQFDNQGRRRRQNLAGMPNPFSPSQVLRSVGRYLDSQDGLLQRAERKGETVTFSYEGSFGAEERETKPVEQLNDSSARRL